MCEVSKLEVDAAVELQLNAARLTPASHAYTRLASEKLFPNSDPLALALDQAGAYIARGECRFQNFCETFARHRASLLSVEAYNRASPDAWAVYATWELSCSAIRRKANGSPWQDPQVRVARKAIRLLHMLAYILYKNVTAKMFKRVAENPERGWFYPKDIDPHQLLAGDEHLPDSLLPLDSSRQ